MDRVDTRLGRNVITTSRDALFTWGRRSSLWWLCLRS